MHNLAEVFDSYHLFGFPIGKLSIQRAAAHILDMYYTNFPIYNPYLEQIPGKNKKMDNYKYYDVDGMGNINDKVSLDLYY